MNFSKQSALGAVMLLGGGVMLYTTINSDSQKQAEINVVDEQDVTLTVAGAEELAVEPLTTDIKTETDILEKQQQEREALVKEQEEKAKSFQESQQLEEKQKAEKFQTEIAKKEVGEPQDESNNTTDQPSVTTEIEQGARTHPIAAGEGLIKVAKEHNVPIEVLAEANDMYFLDGLVYGQNLIIPSPAQIAKLEKSAKINQKKREVVYKAERAKQAAKKRAEEDKLAKARLKEKAEREKEALRAKKKANEQQSKRKEEAQKLAAKKLAAKKEAEKKRQLALTKKANAKKKAEEKANAKKEASKKTVAKKETQAPRGTFGVQVALAGDQQGADAISAKLRKAGYKTKTSQTDRGVRVMVGPVKGKKEALKLKDKINSNSQTGVKNAWVLFWR